MIDRSVFAAFIIAVFVIVLILDIAKGKCITRRVGVVLFIVGVLLGFIYVSAGTGAASSLMFDLMTLLLMTYLLICGIRRRKEKNHNQQSIS